MNPDLTWNRAKSGMPESAVRVSETTTGPDFVTAAIEKHSVAAKCAMLLLRIYKVYFSMLFAGSCRFEPTCSRFAYEAIERFGAARGCWLALKRLLRCHPLSGKFGYDPVPEKWNEMPSQIIEKTHPVDPSAISTHEARP